MQSWAQSKVDVGTKNHAREDSGMKELEYFN